VGLGIGAAVGGCSPNCNAATTPAPAGTSRSTPRRRHIRTGGGCGGETGTGAAEKLDVRRAAARPGACGGAPERRRATSAGGTFRAAARNRGDRVMAVQRWIASVMRATAAPRDQTLLGADTEGRCATVAPRAWTATTGPLLDSLDRRWRTVSRWRPYPYGRARPRPPRGTALGAWR